MHLGQSFIQVKQRVGGREDPMLRERYLKERLSETVTYWEWFEQDYWGGYLKV